MVTRLTFLNFMAAAARRQSWADNAARQHAKRRNRIRADVGRRLAFGKVGPSTQPFARVMRDADDRRMREREGLPILVRARPVFNRDQEATRRQIQLRRRVVAFYRAEGLRA